MTCRLGQRRPVVADGQAEVYVAQEPIFEVHTRSVLGYEPVFRGCAYGSHRSFRLGITANGGGGGGAAVGTKHVVLDGAVVAYERYGVASLGGAAEFYVFVLNLRTGKLLDRVPTGVPMEPNEYHVGVGPVETMVVKPDGAVAWVALDEQRSERIEHEVGHDVNYYDLYALGSSGERLLASGTEVDPSSLALAGGTLYWTQDGKAFSAGLS